MILLLNARTVYRYSPNAPRPHVNMRDNRRGGRFDHPTVAYWNSVMRLKKNGLSRNDIEVIGRLRTTPY